MSAATVAEQLGLDPKGYVNRQTTEDNNINDEEEMAMVGTDRFKDCCPLRMKCHYCQSENTLDYQIVPTKLWPCSNCHRDMLSSLDDAARVAKDLRKRMLRLIKVYHKLVFICQEIGCKYVCPELPGVCAVNHSNSLTKTAQFICPSCGNGSMRPILSHAQLHNQLSYYRYMFSSEEQFVQRYGDRLRVARVQVDKFLNQSAYAVLDLGELLKALVVRPSFAKRD